MQLEGELHLRTRGATRATPTRLSYVKRLFVGRGGRVVVVLLICVGIAIAVHSFLAPSRFPVRSVRFVGHFPNVPRPELISAIRPFLGHNFYALSLNNVATAIQGVPWVGTVTVARHFPRTLDVYVHQQNIIAQWGLGGWVNAKGARVHLKGYAVPANLPLLVGPPTHEKEMLTHYMQFKQILAPLGLVAAQIHLSARGTWRITCTTKLLLVLGNHALARLTRFAQVFPRIAGQLAHMRRIDLRYSNGFAVSWRRATLGNHYG